MTGGKDLTIFGTPQKGQTSPGAHRAGVFRFAPHLEAPMACRCADRRVALAGAARALVRGDTATALRATAAAGRTLAEDARAYAASLAARRSRA